MEVALVTGAAGGIGLATAEAFAKAGASVILADRDTAMIGKATEGLRAAGHNVLGITCDVADAAQVEAMITPKKGSTPPSTMPVSIPKRPHCLRPAMTNLNA